MTNRKGLAFATATLLVAGACSSDNTAQSDEQASGDAVYADDTSTEEETDTTTEDTDSEEQASSDEPAAELPAEGPAGPGVYATDVLGTPVTLDLDQEWLVAATSPGAMVLTDPDAASPEAEVILVMRVDSFAGPDEVAAEPTGVSFSGDPNDIDAWIDATDEILVEASESRSVGDATAQFRDFKLDETGSGGLPGGCGPGPDDRCFFAAATRTEVLPYFIVRTGEHYRMWLIDQGDEDPILVSAHAQADDPGWLDDRAEPFVAGITLGDPAPHPVAPIEGNAWEAGAPSVVPAGEATFPAMGGVTLTLPEEQFVLQGRECLGVQLAYEGDSPLVPTVWIGRSNSYGLGTGSLTSVEDVLDLYEPEVRPEPTGESLTAFGEELTGYRATGVERPEIESMVDCGSNLSILFGPESEVFMADTDEGVLFVAADGFTEDEMADARVMLDEIAPTLAFSS